MKHLTIATMVVLLVGGVLLSSGQASNAAQPSNAQVKRTATPTRTVKRTPTRTVRRTPTRVAVRTATPRPQATATPKASSYRSSLPDRGLASEVSGQTWLNTPNGQPLTLASLRGKVVIVDFWRFQCPTCKASMPGLVQLQRELTDKLVIVGVHTPAFPAERELAGLQAVVKDWQISNPVLVDNEQNNWKLYKAAAYPSIFILDKQGHIRSLFIGSGQDAAIRNAVIDLLKE